MNIKSRGFSLIELMVAIAIIGILASIAIPNYQAYIAKARRADAKSNLTQNAAFLERRYTLSGCYNPGPDNICGNADDDAPDCPPLPHCQSPEDGTAFYTLTVSTPDAASFTVTATPVANSTQKNDGKLELNSIGEKWWDKNNNGDKDAGENAW